MWNGSGTGLAGFASITGVTFPLLQRAAIGTNFGVNPSGSIDAMMVVDQSGTIRRISGSRSSETSTTVGLIRELLAPVPAINASVSSLNFGSELQPGGSQTLSLEVENTGTADLNITQIKSDISELTVSHSTLLIPPGGIRKIEVTLITVEDGILSGTLSFLSNDPENGTLQITIEPLTVKTLPPAIVLGADRLEFNGVEVGRRVNRTLTIRNEGQGALIVTGIESDLQGVSVSSEAFEVPAGESVDLTVTLTPGAEGVFSGNLEILSNDPDRSLIVFPLSGAAVVFRPDARADFNGNGRVDFDDFVQFARAFNTVDPKFDLNESGRVDFDDFVIFARSFGKSVT